MRQGKVFEIPKELVWQSYQQVRKNKGSAGCDGQTLQGFEENRDKNLYKIWNRLSSGSCLPPPVMEKRIPKGDGRERVLGIPTVADRVAQGAVKIYLERLLEPLFDDDSYGYRPNKSAHDSLEKCKRRCWQHSWVLEIDIQSFFDCVRHDLVLKALEHHRVPRWVLPYCRRWLEAPSVNAEYVRHGTRALLDSLDIATGEVVARVTRDRKSATFLGFLDGVVAHYPGQRLCVVMDNLNTHTNKAAMDWLEAHLLVSFHYTPTHASWVNLVECFFSILTRTGLRQQVHKSGKALERFLKEFVETYNKTCGPFTWSKGPEKLSRIIKLTKQAQKSWRCVACLVIARRCTRAWPAK